MTAINSKDFFRDRMMDGAPGLVVRKEDWQLGLGLFN